MIGWIPKGVGWIRAVARPGPPQIRTRESSRHQSTRPVWRRTSEEILEPRGAVTDPSGAAFDQIMDDTVMATWYEGRTDRITAAFVYGSVADGRDRADSDIDVMVISDSVSYPEVYEVMAGAADSDDRGHRYDETSKVSAFPRIRVRVPSGSAPSPPSSEL